MIGQFSYLHNHSIHSATAFKYYPVSHSTKEKINELFEAGHAPGSAYNAYREMLKKEYAKF